MTEYEDGKASGSVRETLRYDCKDDAEKKLKRATKPRGMFRERERETGVLIFPTTADNGRIHRWDALYFFLSFFHKLLRSRPLHPPPASLSASVHSIGAHFYRSFSFAPLTDSMRKISLQSAAFEEISKKDAKSVVNPDNLSIIFRSQHKYKEYVCALSHRSA